MRLLGTIRRRLSADRALPVHVGLWTRRFDQAGKGEGNAAGKRSGALLLATHMLSTAKPYSYKLDQCDGPFKSLPLPEPPKGTCKEPAGTQCFIVKSRCYTVMSAAKTNRSATPATYFHYFSGHCEICRAGACLASHAPSEEPSQAPAEHGPEHVSAEHAHEHETR